VSMFTDGVTAAVEQALSSVSLRQRVAANNIANQNTPNFRASKVDFEADLANAIQSGNPTAAGPTVNDAQTPADEYGNTVQLEQETTTLISSGLQYDALVAALNYKFNLLQTAIKGQ
jgi:flagellar basal-body rod protein FlgB